MNDLTKRDPRIKTKYQIVMYDHGNVATVSLQVGLLARSTMETFDMPLRDSSRQYVEKLTDFGGKLLQSLAKIGGVTQVQILLFEVRLSCGGLFDVQDITEEIKGKLKDLYQHEGFKATGETIIRPLSSEKKKEQIHPFGSLALRLQAVRMRGKFIPRH